MFYIKSIFSISALMVLFIISSLFSSDGKCIPLNQLKNCNLDLDSLRTLYTPATSPVPTDTVAFPGLADSVIVSIYTGIKEHLSTLFHKNGIAIDEDTPIWFDFLFSKDGSIDYCLYNIVKDNIKKKTEFSKALDEFVKEYQFPIKSDKKFGQCGTFLFKKK